MNRFRTVLGTVEELGGGVILPHEHICCYYEQFYQILGESYVDRAHLVREAAKNLRDLKERFGLSALVDCTPINLGCNPALLREVSERAEVHILCSTGFYYTEEPVLGAVEEDYIVRTVLADAEKTNAGAIKFAVEDKTMSPLLRKLLRALCTVQKETGLPLILHTNAKNRNAPALLQTILETGVAPEAVTVGHLSDSDDTDYVAQILQSGCYAGFDRIADKKDGDYYAKKAEQIARLADMGFENRLLISHDGLKLSGFQTPPRVRAVNPYEPVFRALLPALQRAGLTGPRIEALTRRNPERMLLCR